MVTKIKIDASNEAWLHEKSKKSKKSKQARIKVAFERVGEDARLRLIQRMRSAKDEYWSADRVASVCPVCAYSMVLAGVNGVYQSEIEKLGGDTYLTVEEIADICPICAFEMVTAGVKGAYRSDLNRMVQAAKWGKLPKGWTDESVKKFWGSLTGEVKHKVTKCIKKMKDSDIDDPGAFCASLCDKIEGPGWRSKKAAKKTFPQARKEIFDYLRRQGWEVKENIKVPWAKDPDKDVQIWFKSQAVYGVGGLDGGRQTANFGAARSLHTDIRDVTPQEFVRDVMRYFN
jgi:hypothetical protein